MLPNPPPILTGKDAKRFIEQDKKPLTQKQKDHIKECLELYLKKPIKWDA